MAHSDFRIESSNYSSTVLLVVYAVAPSPVDFVTLETNSSIYEAISGASAISPNCPIKFALKDLTLTKPLFAMTTKFSGGVNIAIKIPKRKYEETVSFYRDVLNLSVEEKPISIPTVSRTHEVKFGPNTVWLDCVDNYTHSEVWLELRTSDVDGATTFLGSKGINTCDEIEEIPKDMHWIMDPAGTVFIVAKDGAE